MKTKIFTVLAALAMTAMVSAQSFNRIVVNIEKGSDEDELYLIESPSFTDDFENSYDEVKGFIGNSIYVYGTTAYGSQSMVCTNSLQGAYIGYRATAAGSATITFSNLQSDLSDVTTYYFLDTQNGSATPISTSASYNFSAEAGNYPNRFMIVEPVKVTTNEDGWASFSYDQDLVPVNATAQTLYKGSINGDVLALDPVDYVKADEGVIVNGAASTTFQFIIGSGSADFTGNALKATATYNTSMQNVYVLKGNAFLEYVGTNALALNKAYIQLPAAGPNNAPKRIRMVINGTTAVDNVEAETVKAEKFVEDGQVYIRRGNEVYNLQGQKVNF